MSAWTRQRCLEKIMTPRQRDVFIAIDEFWAKFGYGPSIDDVMSMIGTSSRGSTSRMMRRLCVYGVCKMVPGHPRSIRPSYLTTKMMAQTA